MAVDAAIYQSAAFKEFQDLCREKGILERPAGLEQHDVADGLTDDATLMRFFIARNKDSDAAFQQLKEAFETRKTVNDIAIHQNIDVDIYESTRPLYPHWTGRRTKRGIPICAYDLSYLSGGALVEYHKSRNMPHSTSTDQSSTLSATQRAFATYDTLTRFVLPLCSAMRDRPNPESPVSSTIYLVDASQLTIKQALDVRNYAQDITKLLATCFPEVIDTIYVLNAPSYFSKIWYLVKRFVDPNTASKLVILTSEEVLPTLTQTIDLENIPVQYGGGFSFKQGMVPELDLGLRERLEWFGTKEGMVPTGPLKWRIGVQGRRVGVAVGTEGGEQREVVFVSLTVEDGKAEETKIVENDATMVVGDHEVKVVA
ncbi:putative phosphatidylinositol/phosphatidylcholine transfer protein [Lophiotrema nucula]|uniref:Putative phosphatidylinositol/phosphatidylcholine transfer protein n=1 Tax=Lophiotrema nucula TaxID=690887 RepID=A0A6A5YWW8_9PLEO|nr:putative phosphatidylinositol/phosphatidylcholine transfer protein [Lophiotrema nucula]